MRPSDEAYRRFWEQWRPANNYQVPAAHPAFHAGWDAAVAAYAPIVEFMEWDDVSHWPGCSGDLGYPCKCGATVARATLAALNVTTTP